MTAQQLATGYVALIGGDTISQQSAALYADRLLKEGQTIGQSVLAAYRLGQRMKNQGFFIKTNIQNNLGINNHAKT